MAQQSPKPPKTLTKPLASISDVAQKADINTLSGIAALAVPTITKSSQPTTLTATIDEVSAQGETAHVFSDILSRIHEGNMSRDDLDQRLLTWVLEVPSMRERLGDLSPEMRALVDKFRTQDLKDRFVVEKGVKYPPNPATARKIAVLRSALEA